MSQQRLLALLAISSLAACGQMAGDEYAQIHSAIKGGREVRATEDYAATTVALVIREPGQSTSTCTGSIIADDIILTAAHCVEAETLQIIIAFGENITRRDGVRHSVRASAYTAHEGWPIMRALGAEANLYDIALVRFEGGLPQGAKINKILADEYAFMADEKIILAGFGVSNTNPLPDQTSGSGVLRTAESVPVVESIATEVLVNQATVAGGHGVCYGDSGGPAFVRVNGELRLWGINSRVTSATCDEYAIITDMRKHKDWIETASEALRSPSPAAASAAANLLEATTL